MADFSSLKTKVNSLKAIIAKDSITPSYLGSLLDEIITEVDEAVSDFSTSIASARSDLSTALASEASARAEAVASAEGRLTGRVNKLEADTGTRLARLTPMQLESEEAHAAMVADGSIIPGQIYYTIEN